MKIVVPALATAGWLAVCAHAPLAAQAGEKDTLVEIEGRCDYSDRLAPFRDQGHVFVECDRMILRETEAGAELEFSFPARLREIRMRGGFAADGRFAVRAIQLRSRRDWDEAEGYCAFEPTGNDDGAVTCLVKSGAQFFVVNFASED